MGVTIKDIARMAGVSATTVSNVINGKSTRTSEETRERILALIEQYDYKPNVLARNLVKGKSNTIGLVIPDSSNPFYSGIIRNIENAANHHGYAVILCNTYNDLNRERNYIDLLKENLVDGMIFTSSGIENNEKLMELMHTSFPIVTIDRKIEEAGDAIGVAIDNYKSVYAGVNYLIDLGHRRIGCITGPLSSYNTSERLRGYKEAMSDNGLKTDPSWIYAGEYGIQSGVKGANQMLKKTNKVTAIMACGDVMAYGVYRKAANDGIRIPDDLSVIGFDDIAFSDIITPSLTTLRQPIYEMSNQTVNLLFDLIDGRPLSQKLHTYETELVIRGSTKTLDI